MNEGIPHVIEYAGGALIMLLTLAALYSIICSPIHRVGAKLLWALFACTVPVAGAALWFFTGRETPQERELREALH